MVLGNLTEYIEELEADSFRRGQAEAEARGRAEGEAQERNRIAGGLRAAGTTDAEMARLMGLPLAVVNDLFSMEK